MMIYNWCMAVNDDDENKHLKDENVEELKQFDFLFYIPLQRMSGSRYKITNMIKTLISTATSDELINSILEKDSERCLILADGLDEWTPPKDIPVPQHVSYGIPVQDGINDATLITFSRPSSKGILNMKSSEYDKKLVLRGIFKASIGEFSKIYMAKLNKDKQFIDSFLKAVRQSNLEHLERTPLLLQQLICTYIEERCIGKSLGDIYSYMLNGILHWFENKEEEVEEEAIIVPDEFKHLQLPMHLDRFPRCKINKRFIFLLGKIAFKVLTGDTDSGTFGRSKLQELGLARNDISTLISLGILVEYTSLSPKYEKTCLSFVHISYLEFFAAVYITSHSSVAKVNIPISFLKELFMRYKSASDILYLSNMLKMVCGLCPELITEMSCLIGRNIENDHSMIKYRNKFHTSVCDWRQALQIQDLIMNCLSEGVRKDDQPLISLCDIVGLLPNSSFIQNVDPNSVYSFCFKGEFFQSTGKVSLDFTKFHHLQNIHLVYIKPMQRFLVDSQYLESIYIDEFAMEINHKVLKQLSSSVSKIPSLRHLTMKGIRCNHEHCQEHTIDISNLYNLQNIHLQEVAFIIPSPPQSKHLESFCYSNNVLRRAELNKGMCEQISSAFVQAISLKHIKLEGVVCKQGDCTGHSINLLKQTKLQSIHLENFACQLDFRVQYRYLEIVYISFGRICFNRKTVDHEICKQISQFSHVISLKEFTVRHLRCDGRYCEDHTFDISKLYHLQMINVQNFPCKLGYAQNNTNLKEIEIERSSKFNHEELEQLSLLLTQAKSLYKLTLINITCNIEDCEGHTIDLTEHDNLESIHLDNVPAAFLLPTYAKILENTELIGGNNFKLAHATCDHISSLLTRAVSLETITLEKIACSSAECEGHYIDFSKHDTLNSITLRGVSRTFVISCYSKNLKTLYTDMDVLKHEQCVQISCAISKAVSLASLTLGSMKCEKSNCDGHSIDLSKHDKLRELDLYGSIYVSNTGSIKKLKLAAFSDVLNICANSNLEQLHITDIVSGRFHKNVLYTSDMNLAAQTLQILSELCLEGTDIDENALIVTPEMFRLQRIQLIRVKMSVHTWCKFVDSLLTLGQPVSVCALALSFTQDHSRTHATIKRRRLSVTGLIVEEETARQYVRQKKSLFEVQKDDFITFDFLSKKIDES